MHRLRLGESLDVVAVAYYGHRHYAQVIELFNAINDPSGLEPGAIIRTPKLDAILAEEGVAPMMPYEVYTMLSARAAYMEVESELRSIRTRSRNGYVEVPPDIQAVLRKASQDMWDVAMGLRVVKPGVVAIPNRAIGQLQAISHHLSKISYGAMDAYGYDLDMIHQRLAWVICNEIVWARNGYDS